MPSKQADKPPLLFLCHRLPYPPTKGDKIRAWHLLDQLSQSFSIFLGTFVDDERDWQFVDYLRSRCVDTCILPLSPSAAKVRSLTGFFSNESLSLVYYRSKELQRWVSQTIAREGIERGLAFCSPMAQYFMSDNLEKRLSYWILDLVDVDSDKWQQYAKTKSWPQSFVFKREAELLLKFEKAAAGKSDATFLVSEREAEAFRDLSPSSKSQVNSFSNGVDSGYFRTDMSRACPFPAGTSALVFTGAMDYWPNEDAVVWFANEVLPSIRARWSEIEFWVVGSKPGQKVRELEAQSGVRVTGWVDDVRPYLQHALAVVAPMRIGRGIQNKVLEAMAMEKPVLVSTLGLEGIGANHGETVMLCNSIDDFVNAVESLLEERYADLGQRARALVQRDFDWGRNLSVIRDLLLSADGIELDLVKASV